MKRTLILAGCLLVLAGALVGHRAIGALAARPGTGHQEENDPRAITVVKAGRVITVTGAVLEDATIVIRNGKIEAVGENVDYPFGAKVIDARDKVVMPGMINPVSRATNLPAGNGLAPHSVKADDLVLKGEDLRAIAATGYTTLGLVSPGAPMPGRVLVVRTAGEKPADLVLEAEGPVQIAFSTPGSSKAAVLQAFGNAKKEQEKVAKAREDWEKKKNAPKPKEEPKPEPKPGPNPQPQPAPQPQPTPQPKAGEALADPKPEEKKDDKKGDDFSPPPINPQWKPLVDLLEKTGPAAIVEFGQNIQSVWSPRPSTASTYMHFEDVLEEYSFPHSYRIFNSVVEKNSPFYVQPETNVEEAAAKIGKLQALIALYPVVNHHPFTRDKYNLGLLFMRHGARPVYIPERDTWAQYDEMRDNLIQMVRAGYPREKILETVTINAAAMLGLEGRLGSIEAGKDANLVILSGDPLAFDSKVEKVLIEGKVIEIKPRLR